MAGLSITDAMMGDQASLHRLDQKAHVQIGRAPKHWRKEDHQIAVFRLEAVSLYQRREEALLFFGRKNGF